MSSFLRLIPFGIVVALVVGFLSYAVLQNRDAVNEADRALCALRQGYTEQANATNKYLKTHPDGLPQLGVTAGQLRQQVVQLRARAASLSDVTCASRD